jgi:hypothetical protein
MCNAGTGAMCGLHPMGMLGDNMLLGSGYNPLIPNADKLLRLFQEIESDKNCYYLHKRTPDAVLDRASLTYHYVKYGLYWFICAHWPNTRSNQSRFLLTTPSRILRVWAEIEGDDNRLYLGVHNPSFGQLVRHYVHNGGLNRYSSDQHFT